MTRLVTVGSDGSGERYDRLEVVIIDLEENPFTFGFEDPEVVLLMRVVGMAEIVIDGDRFDDAAHRFNAERRNAGRYYGHTSAYVLT